jgi:hypothetical protein
VFQRGWIFYFFEKELWMILFDSHPPWFFACDFVVILMILSTGWDFLMAPNRVVFDRD